MGHAAARLTPAGATRRPEPEITSLIEQLFLTPGDQAPHVVVVASLGPTGQTTCVAGQMAEALTQQVDDKVCAIDTDFLSSSFDDYFGLQKCEGLGDAFDSPSQTSQFTVSISNSNLSVLSSGSHLPKASTAGISSRIRSCVQELSREFKYILISVRLATVSPLPPLLGQFTDGVVLVIEANRTRRDLVQKVCGELKQGEVPILGVVLTNRTFPVPAWLYRRL